MKKVKGKNLPESVSETVSSTSNNQPEKETKKYAQVDEQLFQEELAISLSKEEQLEESRTKRKSAPKVKRTTSKTSESGSQTIISEFQSMVEDMFPSAKKEKIAGAKAPGNKKQANASKKKQKKKKRPKKKKGVVGL